LWSEQVVSRISQEVDLFPYPRRRISEFHIRHAALSHHLSAFDPGQFWRGAIAANRSLFFSIPP